MKEIIVMIAACALALTPYIIAEVIDVVKKLFK